VALAGRAAGAGYEACLSDAGVAAAAALAGAEGACLNVLINARSARDPAAAATLRERAGALIRDVRGSARTVLDDVGARLA
jgi:formiminotetrahydrofolate cyclodeaminase